MDAIDRFATTCQIAYFSMEIALRPEVHSYSGGLGVLAGDTVRSCADLELPVVFVTLVSHAGYLRQEIDAEGRQIEHPDPWQPAEWARLLGAKVAITLEGREVWIQPWLYVHVSPAGGQVPVLLLDTDLDDNAPEDRILTHHLYGGDNVYRLKQEAVLGIGGFRLLRALGFVPHSYHLNEGHAALLAVDLLRRTRRNGGRNNEPSFDPASVRAQCIFTTHTPVEAGHDRFGYDLVAQVLGDFIDPDLIKPLAGDGSLNMTRLALNLSGFINGVARRHAETATRMFPGYRVHAITNGVHAPTWAHPSFARLYESHFPNWGREPELLLGADQLADDAIWPAHLTAKADLVALVRNRCGIALDPEKPIIGYARRMTAYKRPDLLFSDLARLRDIAARHPFQVVMAGKAHPRDSAGKEAIRQIHRLASELRDVLPIAFVPNYDMSVAKSLVTGTDIWLNTPQPPMEASGTSGMKAALNGVLNLSTLDGWWVEGCIDGVTGWSIGNGDAHNDDAMALYDKLDTVVLPLYGDAQTRWLWMMKQAISKLAPVFSSQRMMRRYASEAYLRSSRSPA